MSQLSTSNKPRITEMLEQLICMSRTCNYASGSVTHRIAEFVLKRSCARRPPESTPYSDFYIVNILLLIINLKSHYVEHFLDPETPHVARGWVNPVMDGQPHRCSTDFEQTLGGHLTRRGVGCPRVPLGTCSFLV